MDRFWIGYWSGGVSLAANVLVTHMLYGNRFAAPAAIIGWFCATPIGIYIAKRVA